MQRCICTSLSSHLVWKALLWPILATAFLIDCSILSGKSTHRHFFSFWLVDFLSWKMESIMDLCMCRIILMNFYESLVCRSETCLRNDVSLWKMWDLISFKGEILDIFNIWQYPTVNTKFAGPDLQAGKTSKITIVTDTDLSPYSLLLRGSTENTN